MSEDKYDYEVELQDRISQYPDLLAGDQMDESKNKSWLLVTREYDIPDDRESGGNWSIDHLFLDEDGLPTFVEVKRGEDPRVRRTVVGQMLDYVSHAVAHESGHNLRERFESQHGRESAIERIADLIDADYEDRDSIQEFWEGVNANLRAGRVRILFVADRMPPELRSIIEFLNEQMDPAEVLGFEVKRYSNDNEKILVPSLLGDTSKSKGDSGGREVYDTTLKDLVESNEIELSEGDTLYMYYNDNQYKSTICEDGAVKFEGRKNSLSGAAKDATEKSINGWLYWETEDGKSLNKLRDKYES